MKKIGLTATRTGLTSAQARCAEALLDSATEVHHGDCVGGDEDLHDIVRRVTSSSDQPAKIVVHPPDNDRLQAFCEADESREPLPYLVRDQCIVDETDMLLAFPAQMCEIRQSGTWATVRMARRAKKPVIVVWPDGKAGPGDTSKQTKENRGATAS